MKLIDILKEQEGHFSTEDLKKEIENLKLDINNARKVCVLFYRHLKTMNFVTISNFKKNILGVINNIELVQRQYHQKYSRYDEIYEKYGDDDDFVGDWYKFYKLKDELYDLQFDMDDIRELMSDLVENTEKDVYQKLNKRYNDEK